MPSETACLARSLEVEWVELCELLGRQGWSQGELGAIFCRRERFYYPHTHQSRTQGADYEFYLLNYWRIKRSRNVWDPSSSLIKGPPSRLQINFPSYLTSRISFPEMPVLFIVFHDSPLYWVWFLMPRPKTIRPGKALAMPMEPKFTKALSLQEHPWRLTLNQGLAFGTWCF